MRNLITRSIEKKKSQSLSLITSPSTSNIQTLLEDLLDYPSSNELFNCESKIRWAHVNLLSAVQVNTETDRDHPLISAAYSKAVQSITEQASDSDDESIPRLLKLLVVWSCQNNVNLVARHDTGHLVGLDRGHWHYAIPEKTACHARLPEFHMSSWPEFHWTKEYHAASENYFVMYQSC